MSGASPVSPGGGPSAEARGRGALPRRLLRRPGVRIGLAGVLLFLGLACFAPWIVPEAGRMVGSAPSLEPPSPAHPCGTDLLGRDVLSRLLLGSRLSLTVALLATAIAVTAGTFVGAIAGLSGGIVDPLLMRFTDLFLAVPRVVLLLSLAAFFRGSPELLVAILSLTGWMGTARIVRAEALSIRERDYVAAARSFGASRTWILLRHVLPNVLTPVLVTATLGVGNTLLLEAGLSYLGFGPEAGEPSWGVLIREGKDVLADGWWVSAFPGAAIVLSVLFFSVLGDEIRAELEPRSRGLGLTP